MIKSQPWYVRLLLFFRPIQMERSTDGLWVWMVWYKTLRGKRYVHAIYPEPVEHYNCRCGLEKADR